jgi:hypothetical protein
MKLALSALGLAFATSALADPLADGLTAFGSGDYDAAIAAYDAGCKAGTGKACYNAAAVLAKLDLDSDARETRQVAMYERGCAANDLLSCKAAGDLLAASEDKPEAERGLKAYAKACSLGNAQACGALGGMQSRRSDRYDFEAGRASWEAGCKGGDLDSCFVIAERAEGEASSDEERAVAQRKYATLCDSGNAQSCETLAVRRFASIGGADGDTAAILKDAARLYERACRFGVYRSTSCDALREVPIP